MKVPDSINGRFLTKEDKELFYKNRLNKSTVINRVNRGFSWEDSFKSVEEFNDKGVIVSGHFLTERMLEQMGSNNLTVQQVRTRVFEGWSIEKAISTPMRKQKKPRPYNTSPKLSKEEAKQIVLRVRKLNATEYKDNPFSIPKIEELAGVRV